ncbi:hypothetical protein FS837_002085 [Tulasnella sp. UAMH 9824]|nr:hypothetical protein FS837_002085 [Tulasnella sp. UAMH 9824]
MVPVRNFTIPVAGLAVDVYSLETDAAVQDVAIVFLLHGRTGSAKSEYVKIMINSILQHYDEQRRGATKSDLKQDLVIVTYVRRNELPQIAHPNDRGVYRTTEIMERDWFMSRLIMPGLSVRTCQIHGISGAAKDISFLIDFLPSYLYPNGERNVVDWGIIGLSLGGDASWIVLKDDPRVTLGIPVIACPDYLGVMEFRAKQSGVSTSPPSFPDSLRRYIQQHDVLATPFNQDSRSNPFLGKHILVLSSGADTLVPFEQFCKPFVDGLEVGVEGTKRVVVLAGVGHEITDEMREEAARFIWLWLTRK